MLVNRFGWSRDEARAVWAFAGTNVLVDVTCGVSFLNDARPHIVSAFEEVVEAGPLCKEPLRGVCIRITDAKLHGDSHHRGPSELLPAAGKAIRASLLKDQAAPALVEPVFEVTVDTDVTSAGALRAELPRRRGVVHDEQHTAGGMVRLIGNVPVSAAFGLTAELRGATQGRAFPICTFDHWRLVPGDVLLAREAPPKGKTGKPQATPAAPSGNRGDLSILAVAACRERNGLRGGVPHPSVYEDKL